MKRLSRGLGRSAKALSDGIGTVLSKRKLDAEALDELEEILITADLGAAAAARLVGDLGGKRFDKDVDADAVRMALADDVAEILAPVARPLVLDPGKRPHVVLVVGVNGTGKTTTIGKLANRWQQDGRKVMLAAGDTFRAAAVEQLCIWGDRAGVPVVTGKAGGDPAGLAYDALARARDEACDVLAIDTAGRLHNKADLMDELAKMVRVLRKLDETAPHDVVLVLDATTGQNAHRQVEVFRDIAEVSGLVVTKLDGSARGGVVVALAERFGLPIHAVGVGEGAEDLRDFEAGDFARSLMGLET
ncbi:MAG: signal recognition particle-docking protein FtsY [Alphaproteobacteria bacterium]|nr:signal recognition particle-docking protein FtsY [Alphaproteobacteria bacterium]